MKFDAAPPVVLKWLQEEKNKQHELGFFPLLALTLLGDNLSSSFVERVNSALKLIMGNGRTMLHPTELGQLAVLRINRAFMEHMKKRRKRKAEEAKAAAKAAAQAAAALGRKARN